MNFIILSSILLLSFAIWAWILQLLKSKSKKSGRLPPGPKPYPIIGNILDLGKKPQESLVKLSQIYGPLIHLKLGSLTTIVVSSPEIAKLFLQKHDELFSARHHPCSVHALDHHKLSMAWIPVGNQWRKLRRICKEHMFSVARLDSSQGLRRDKLQKLCEYVRGCCINGKAVDIGRAAFTTSLNMVSATLFSKELADIDSGSCEELMEAVWGIIETIGKPNLADYFPVLRVLDPWGIMRKNTDYYRKCFDIFEEMIRERLEIRGTSVEDTRKSDMLESLLDINQRDESELSILDIKHLLLDLFVAGANTGSSTVEWAMSELLRHPDEMLKVKNELREIIGKNEQVTESDIQRLPYLRAVVKETFRFHPAIPLLVPRKSEEETEINGYIIPKNAQIIINAWAIGRDSSTWSDSTSFTPERFLKRETDFKGQHFELVPFGAGRRICPGLPLANRVIHLTVATLVHNFEWKLDGGLKPEEVDMAENFGVTMQKAIPLKAVPTML